MKVVLDTNVLISALLFKGKLGAIFNLIEDGRISPCFIPSTLQEFKEVLEREKFKTNLRDLGFTSKEIIDAVLEKSFLLPEPAFQISVIKEDPPDNKFLACALTCQAFCIVSGDNKHLLRLKKFQGIPIFSPHEFLEKLKSITS